MPAEPEGEKRLANAIGNFSELRGRLNAEAELVVRSHPILA